MLRREANPLFGRTVASLLGVASRATGPEALVTLWANRWEPDAGEELQTTWHDFLDVLAERRPWRGPHAHPGWSACSFSPMVRAPANVRSVGAVLAHVRHGASTFDYVASALADVAGIAFSTHEHVAVAHAFSIAIPFARPASVREHAAAGRWLARRLASKESKGVLIERQPYAFAYLPSWRPVPPVARRTSSRRVPRS